MYVLYIDVVWIVNFLMDAVILSFAAWMANRRVRVWRIVAGSALGACYALFLFVPEVSQPAMSLAAKFLFSCLMVLIAYRPRHVIGFLRDLGLFYLASFVVGGAVFALNYMISDTRVLGGMVLISGAALWNLNIGFLTLMLSALTLYLIGKAVWQRIEKQRNREAHLCRVRIEVDGIRTEMTGLIDTGNALTDPISGLPVAVVEWQALVSVLPFSLQEVYKANRDATLALGDSPLEPRWQSRLQIVPYRGVGGAVGMLLGFRPCEFVILSETGSLQPVKLIVAVNPKPLSTDQTYQAILPPACMSETDSSLAS
ncbi:sigma-E processing peptidase SpoIIGA [Effusibacillus lacus]|uniref:Membrane-associated aspartic protease n=1 Tax=Effusibacillus lacus TaxID=1348429 RepID=A0A292YIT1_9BACL|nr:sigma-E processing peptidase SpoIIGA [Effusibacillus lacus]TCS75676.1 stage II sporulation protein GA (sporulation sigma-E factor processing peptidase) [Effusibacillus lacus]GAX90997.1 hypothetical protein EFBL_2657 [Effusibacillus lacus]